MDAENRRNMADNVEITGGDIERAVSKSGDVSGVLVFDADPARYARILRLMREQNPKNHLPDTLCKTGATLFIILSAVSLAVWGAVFFNSTWLLRSWLINSLAIGLPALLLSYFRNTTGLSSWLHRYTVPSVSLGDESLTMELRLNIRWRASADKIYKYVIPYKQIRRIEYDRGVKLLRIYGTPDNNTSVFCRDSLLPEASRPRDGSTGAREKGFYIEVPLIFGKSGDFVRELESRCGVYAALRGDDYAELRDLPGLRPDHQLVRPMSVILLLSTLCVMLAVLALRGYYSKYPYTPYEKTDPAILAAEHGLKSLVTLDGLDITVESVTRVGRENESCYQVLLRLENHNENAVRLRVGKRFRDSETNLAFFTVNESGVTGRLELTEPPPGYPGVYLPPPDKLEPGKNTDVTLYLVVPDGTQNIMMTVNSDYWPPEDMFRDVYYKGGYVMLDGEAVKDNEVKFVLDKSLFK